MKRRWGIGRRVISLSESAEQDAPPTMWVWVDGGWAHSSGQDAPPTTRRGREV